MKSVGGRKNTAKMFYSAIFFLIACFSQGFCCGGGYMPMPYIPTSSGNINTPSSKGSFFLIEKGSASELFDIKKLQPLFRNIHLSGNERKNHEKTETMGADSSLQTQTDKPPMDSAKSVRGAEKTEPVLNLHRIH